jgi:hypothetical protein
MNKLLMEENDRLQKQLSRLIFEKEASAKSLKTHIHNVSYMGLCNGNGFMLCGTNICLLRSAGFGGHHGHELRLRGDEWSTPSAAKRSSAASAKGCEQPSWVTAIPSLCSLLNLIYVCKISEILLFVQSSRYR